MKKSNIDKAMALLMGLDTYARHGGFHAQHCAVMQNPTPDALRTVLAHVRNNPTSRVREDDHLRWVYEYWVDIHECGDRYYPNFVEALAEWDELRFPSARSQWVDHNQRYATWECNMCDYAWRIRELTKAIKRDWHHREQGRGPIHSAILKACNHAGPADMVQLVLEWPRASKEGEHKIAYTRDDKYGENDRQLTTSVGKYLTRHFPALSSSTIRDISARYCEASFQIIDTLPEMVHVAINGPGSCMAKPADAFRNLNGVHPYEVYDPEYGWAMAVVKEGNVFTGRALVNDNKYVRTYRRQEDCAGNRTSYSDVDERLTAWLEDQGFQRRNGWRGFKLAHIDARNDCGFVAPYLDGSDQEVDVEGDYLRIVNEGEYACNNQNGDATARSGSTCEDCNERMDDDDTYHVYRDSSRCVCQHCYGDSYTMVYGRRGDRYAVDNDDAVEVNGEYYDCNWLDDNEIVQLHDGEYCHQNDAVLINSVDAWYPSESDYICYTKAGEYELSNDCVELEDGEYCLTEDAWQCDHSGDYYENDVDSVATKCGKRIHEDYADEYELENDDATPVAAE